MQFIKLNQEQWARRDHYEHYKNVIPCTYSLTVPIDVSPLLAALKARGLKAYPAQIYMLAAAVNQFPEFRMSTDEHQCPGYWDTVNPSYTVLNPRTETFSVIWTKYTRDFSQFYQACLDDTAHYATGALFPQADPPPNLFNISSVPWLDFSAFHLSISSGENYLLPIFTIGKYAAENGRTLMPLAIQCHHSVCDGFHVAQFVEALRRLASTPEDWL